MKEIRSIEQSEFRIEPNSRKIEGYALLFNTESQDLGGFREKIAPEAINGVLERSDVLALYNHNENNVLARNTAGNGTLSLKVDEKGLKYSFSAPKTALGDEVLDAIQRGDLRNSSFAFTITDSGQKWEKRNDGYLRTITQFDKLYDVSPVFFPAYLDTTVASRSLDELKFEEIPENIVEEREVTVEVKVEVKEDDEKNEDVEQEPQDQPVDEVPVEQDDIEPEKVEIFYNGNSYFIPRSIIDEYIKEGENLRELKSYIDNLKDEVLKIKSMID